MGNIVKFQPRKRAPQPLPATPTKPAARSMRDLLDSGTLRHMQHLRSDTLKLLEELEGSPLVQQMHRALPAYAAEAKRSKRR